MVDRPWLNHYDHKVPHTLWPYPNETLNNILEANVRTRPDHPVIDFYGTRISYAILESLSNAFAKALLSYSVKKGDRVALMLPNCPQFLICQLGAWKVGAIVSPLNPMYSKREMAHALQDTGAEIAVVLTPFYEKVKSLQESCQLRLIVATNIKEYFPRITRILFTLTREEREGHRIKLKKGDFWLQDFVKQHGFSKPLAVKTNPDDPALLMFTGGTGGAPKAALSSHQALLMSGMQLHAWLSPIREDWRDTTLLVMPMYHTYGNVGVFSASMIGRNTMVPIPDPRDLKFVISTIIRTKPAYFCGVPALFTALLNHPDVVSGKVDFTSFKLCLCGAAPLMAETKRRYESLTQGRIVEGYALTESVMATVMTPVQGTYKPGAVGIPLPDVMIRIVDQFNNREVFTQGETGEVQICAPQLMLGYWRRPDATAAILRDGWLSTGDIGYMDHDGYLFLVDRAKDLIKPSGFQVWPREVEEVLATHPAISEVGVAGIPDPVQGEAVKAWIVLRNGEAVTEAELRAYCRERLTAYKVPRFFEFRSNLPKSSVNKVLRRELVAQEQPEVHVSI